jgi:hypothetical protein
MYSLSREYVEQNNRRYYIPCPLVPFIDEIIEGIKTQSVREVMLSIASEKGIQLLPTIPTRRLYTYGPAAPVKTTTGSISWFILGESGQNRIYNNYFDAVIPLEIQNDTDYTYKPLDSRFLYTSITSTFSYGVYATNTMTYAEMKTGSPLLYKLFDDSIKVKYITDTSLNKFYPFTEEYPFTLSCICSTINSNIPDQVGYIINDTNGKLLFVPAIHKQLRYLYTPNKTNDLVYFTNIGCTIFDNTSAVLYKYTKRKLTVTEKITCYRK